MAAKVTIQADAEGLALAKLAELIELRAKYMGSELTRDSVTATALNVTTSLKSQAKVAPFKDNARVPATAYTITPTNFYGGICNGKICARVGSHHGQVASIKPFIGINPGDRAALRSRVYFVETANPHDTFAKNRNAPAQGWYILAENEGAVRRIITTDKRRFVKRIFAKEGGLLKWSLTQAQIKIHSGGKIDAGPQNPKVRALGENAAVISTSGESGNFAISVTDKLGYSLPGLKQGEQTLTVALMKAANRTAGILNAKFAGYKFKDPIPTPFPEVAGRNRK